METVNITLDFCDFGFIFWSFVLCFQAVVLGVCYICLKKRDIKNLSQQLLLLLPVSLPIMTVFAFFILRSTVFETNIKENYKRYFGKYISEHCLPDVPVAAIKVDKTVSIISIQYMDGQQRLIPYENESPFTLKAITEFCKNE